MNNHLNQNTPQKSNGFIRLPLRWARRKDLSPAFKIIVGYINTRSTAILTNGMAWTISAADIMYQTGLSKSMVYKSIKVLIEADILIFFQTIKGKFEDYKIYKINRKNLLTYLKASPQKELAITERTGPSPQKELEPVHRMSGRRR